MYKISWEATHGYGDILSAYCYSSRISYEKNIQVNLNWWWYPDRPFYPPKEKYLEDPESVYERMELIKKFVDIPSNIVFTEEVREPWEKGEWAQRPKFENRKKHGWMSTTWKMKDEPCDDGHVAVWTSAKNKIDWRTHPIRQWKIPFPKEFYDEYVQLIENKTGKKVIHVDYTMPVDEVFDIIRTSSFCFGNDGIGNVISKNYFKPLIVTSKNEYLTTYENSGQWVYVIDPKREFSIKNMKLIEQIIDIQKDEIEEYRSRCY
jgi:hypothetical protein